ncbi:hypothetical protein ACVWYO_004765 [Sphingomonas sp. UYP23]
MACGARIGLILHFISDVQMAYSPTPRPFMQSQMFWMLGIA